MAWHMDLHMGYDSQVFIPFHEFVKTQPPRQTTRIFPFFDLPGDLQLMIYDHCDASTLFHLMRTCSRTRGPASARFWSCPDHWYNYNKCEVFSGGDHVVREHDLQFVSLVKRVELGVDRLEWRFCPDNEGSVVAKAQDFWTSLVKVFPAIENVVIRGYFLHEPSTYSAIRKAVECAPGHITVLVALETGNIGYPRHYTLYSVPADLNRAWEILDENWTPTRVLLPPRKFPPSSILGAIITLHRRERALLRDTRGLDWLRIESYARYAVNGKIHCPRMDCDAVFTNREEWEKHLDDYPNGSHGSFETRWRTNKGSIQELLPYKHTPEAEKAAMEAQQQRIDRGYDETSKLQRRIGYAWGPPGSEQRRFFDEQFVIQLKEENMWEPGTVLIDYGLYESLHVMFNRTHIYGHQCNGPDGKHPCYDE